MVSFVVVLFYCRWALLMVESILFGHLIGLDLRGICVIVMFCVWGVCGYYARFVGEFDVVYCCCVVFCFCFGVFVVSCLFYSSGFAV